MKNLLSLFLFVVFSGALVQAQLPHLSKVITDRSELLTVLGADHDELTDSKCIQTIALDSGFAKARTALLVPISDLSITYYLKTARVGVGVKWADGSSVVRDCFLK